MKNSEKFIQLSDSEMVKICGGYNISGFVGEIGSLITATANTVTAFFTASQEYQSSLPANLKK